MISAATFFPAKLVVEASGDFHVLVNLGPRAMTTVDSATATPAVYIAIRLMNVPFLKAERLGCADRTSTSVSWTTASSASRSERPRCGGQALSRVHAVAREPHGCNLGR